MTNTLVTRYRGDTVYDQWTIRDESGVVQNITGYSFLLTVSTIKDPPDDTTQVFQLVGSIFNASGGVVRFTPNSLQADQVPGKYYYDIQMIDSGGGKQTIRKGVYKFLQDITKV